MAVLRVHHKPVASSFPNACAEGTCSRPAVAYRGSAAVFVFTEGTESLCQHPEHGEETNEETGQHTGKDSAQTLISDGSAIADKASFWNSLLHLMPNLICRNSLGINSRTSIWSNGEFGTYGISVCFPLRTSLKL